MQTNNNKYQKQNQKPIKKPIRNDDCSHCKYGVVIVAACPYRKNGKCATFTNGGR